MEAYRFVETNYAADKNQLVVIRPIEEISRDANPKEYLAQVTLAALQDPRVASMLTRRQFFAEALKRIVIAQLRVQAFKTGLAKVVFYDPLLKLTTPQAQEQLAFAMDRLSSGIENDRRGRLAKLAIPEGYKRLGVHGLIVPSEDYIRGYLFPPLSKGDYLASLTIIMGRNSDGRFSGPLLAGFRDLRLCRAPDSTKENHSTRSA
jgi:hypothetical protein